MSERLRKRGTVWYASVDVHHPDGSVTTIERTTGCRDKAAARSVRAGWEREAADPDHAAARTTINDALTLLLDERAKSVAENDGSAETVNYYRFKIGHLVRVLGHHLPVSAIRDSKPAWRDVDQRRGESANTRTIAKELKVLRTGLTLAKSRASTTATPPSRYRRTSSPRRTTSPDDR